MASDLSISALRLLLSSTLRSRSVSGFSKTARSRPRHREAGRHRLHRPSRAEVCRRLSNDVVERPAERPKAREADVHADLGDLAFRGAEEEHRALDAPPLQIPMRRLAEGVAERAAEMR